ncbi:hypothetical protein MACH26_28070 [Planctobacterium marinum]|uniref:Calcineurin-like phosphoesterase domain-containing protein n=2 Tax=Planctobacterium marinum TaxID=1631968 RepID=A0AA48HM21_9ALTE|nr:hypothetical protein MACH26_28070 [Planctobacterium marinum]
MHASATVASYGSYVILGEAPSGDNIAIARTVIDTNQTCPTVSEVVGGSDISMISRDNPNHFSVLVCEALIEFDKSYQINFASGAVLLPMAKSNPENILVYGDTGCSHCAAGTAAEPFKTLADAGAAKNADLVLHMGDYNYRGTSGKTFFSSYQDGKWQQLEEYTYDAGDGESLGEHCGQVPGQPFLSQSASNSNRPDIWENWQDDLFLPADSLMTSAPWIVARGNHELCSRAGPGYFYFLDHNTRLTGSKQLSCPIPDAGKDAEHNTVQIPNYVVSFEHLDIAVIDSANACDNSSQSPFTKKYKKVFSELESAVGENPAWLMTHRPIYGVEKPGSQAVPCTSKNDFSCINQMMQAALKQLKSKSLPAAVELIFTGHMHRFESVSFPGSKRAPNIVVGSSGVSLSSGAPYGANTTEVDGEKALVLSTSNSLTLNGVQYPSFGYMSVSVAEDGSWQSELLNPEIPEVIVTCNSEQKLGSGVCELGKGISVEH